MLITVSTLIMSMINFIQIAGKAKPTWASDSGYLSLLSILRVAEDSRGSDQFLLDRRHELPLLQVAAVPNNK